MNNFSTRLLNFTSLLFWVLLMSVSSCKKFVDYEKTYTISGRVIDQSSNPVADVKIRWHYDDTSTPEAVLGYTDSRGNYSILYSTRIWKAF